MIGRTLLICWLGLCLTSETIASEARIKDITTIKGPQDNQLFGYGLVIGLQGTGDSLRNVPFLAESLRSMLDRMGIRYGNSLPRTKNIAAVAVTARMPPFSGKGAKIDVDVSSIGDASSLNGGTLILTPLYGANREVYAVAQGPLTVTGFAKEGEAKTVSSGVPTTGRIPAGAVVEREINGNFQNTSKFSLQLRNSDFETAVSVTDRINRYTRKRYGKALARERDASIIDVLRPPKTTMARFIAVLGRLRVKTDTPARVVIDESTGTVVIGSNVRISTVAATHGNLTVRISERPTASQPEPFSEGETVLVPATRIGVAQPEARIAILRGVNLQTLVDGLNRIGLKPTGIIAILQAIKTTGALQAELIVQ